MKKNTMETQKIVSRFAEYSGYSAEPFDSWLHSSQYIEMDDGVRLAADIVRPAVNGQAVDEPLPVLLTFTPYQRNNTGMMRFEAEQAGEPVDDRVITLVDERPVFQHLIKHGYVVVCVGVRGGDASFGQNVGVFSRRETDDSYQVIDWLARQPWSSGNIGMLGESYLGVTQYMVASRHHPALKAIVPDVAPYDLYDIFYNGGIYQNDYINQWGEAVRALDTQIEPIPVDEDTDGSLMRQAIAEHAGNWTPQQPFADTPFRDSEVVNWNWRDYGVMSVLDQLNSSGVAIYHFNGWYDGFAYQAPLSYLNYPGPSHLLMGPWGHDKWNDIINAERDRVSGIEHLRWFDYWLKGIDNGIVEQNRVNYAINEVPGQRWRWASSPTWPVEGIQDTVWYFSGEKSNSVDSLNDGLLSTSVAGNGDTSFKVDPSTTTGTTSRWDNCAIPCDLGYPDMSDNDRKSLTFTTAPLEQDVTVLGYPMVHLQARTDQTDGDFYLLLEEVDSQGFVHLVSEGRLRLSMRKHDPEHKAVWHDQFWRRQNREDVLPVEPGQWYDVEIPLIPTGYLFNQGHRIRVTVMGADKDNTEAPVCQDAELSLRFGGEKGSRIILPVMQAG